MSRGVVKGILWHQGEANAETLNATAGYESDLRNFIAKLRAGLGNNELPFLSGTLADFCRYPYKDTVNAAMRRVAAAVPRMYIISTADLSGKADSLHFDSAGQRALGRRFAAVAASLL